MKLASYVARAKGSLSSKFTNISDHRFWQDRLSLVVIISTLVLNGLTLIVLLAKVRPTEFAVPVTYSSLVGFELLGPWYEIYRIVVFAGFVTVLNTTLAYKSFQRSRITSFFLLVGAFVIALFCLIIGTAFTAVV